MGTKSLEQSYSDELITNFNQPAPYPAAAVMLRGWPGFRDRNQRSGLDPVDTFAEYGHILGVFIHILFSGKLRTTNTVYLCLMGIAGCYLLFPLVFIFGSIQDYTIPSFLRLIASLSTFSPYLIIGIRLLVNLIANLVRKLS